MNIPFADIRVKFFSTILRSLIITILGIIIAYLLLQENVFEVSGSCHNNGFARRWDGTCDGWTKELAIKVIRGNLLHWWAYTTIAMTIWLNHPILKGSITSFLTVYMSGAFVFGCGITHLMEAYTVLNPLYWVQAWLLEVNGWISVISMFYVVYGLLRVTIIANKRREQLSKLKVG